MQIFERDFIGGRWYRSLPPTRPTVDVFAKDSRGKLDPVRKVELKKDIPSYNWDDQRIAIREFLAFTCEDNPAPVLDKAKGCEF
jgi:hypothetical protein